jgi:hypothetical protein
MPKVMVSKMYETDSWSLRKCVDSTSEFSLDFTSYTGEQQEYLFEREELLELHLLLKEWAKDYEQD